MHLKEALDVVRNRLNDTQEALTDGIVSPNIGNGKDHVFKIICGAGNHSVGKRGVLKHEIAKYLQN